MNVYYASPTHPIPSKKATFVIIKNVDPALSDHDVGIYLQNGGYNYEFLKRFRKSDYKKLPIVLVQLPNDLSAEKLLNQRTITIGWRISTTHPYQPRQDKSKPLRPL